MDPWKFIKMGMVGAIILGIFAWICLRTPTYPPTPPMAANMIASGDTIAQAKAALQEFFVAWNERDGERYKALSASHETHDFSQVERIEVGEILFVRFEGPDKVIFSAPICFYYVDSTNSPLDNGEVVDWTYEVVRGADGCWRVSNMGWC